MNRFLVLATARTGSNMLVRSLNKPPRTRCLGEVGKLAFGSEPDAFSVMARLSGQSEAEIRDLHGRDVGAFVYDVVYQLPGEAVGFKLFYEHCRRPGREDLWRRLGEDTALSVVHLTRDATFDLYLSLLYAQRTGQWLRRPGDGAGANDLDDIEVDVDHCRAFLSWYLDQRREAAALFSGHRYMEIDYAEPSADLAGALARVRRFIGAPTPMEDQTPLQKQAARPAAEKVRNYAALKATFAGTELASMFPGCP